MHMNSLEPTLLWSNFMMVMKMLVQNSMQYSPERIWFTLAL